jgi:hypothetical protein
VVSDTRSQNGNARGHRDSRPGQRDRRADESNNAGTRQALVQGSKASLAP